MNLSSLKNKISKIPKTSGIYIFKDKSGDVLYVGKATNLRSRVRSYFRGGEAIRLIGYAIDQIADIETRETDSVLEALILESHLIKKLQPKYNAMGKDDKSFSYIALTKEDFPKFVILHKTDVDTVQNAKFKVQNYNAKFKIKYTKFFGPYTSKKQMEIALKILRKIFPFHSINQKTEKGCLDFQIGRCPGPYAGAISKADYAKNIRGIRMILEGKKKSLVGKLEREMKAYAKNNEFEKAADARNKVFALKHIRDVALISREDEKLQITNHKSQTNSKFKIQNSKFLRIEAYDISNISGQHAVGSMVVFKNNEPDKSQYRKFKIKTVGGSDDVRMMKEILIRRFKNDWPMPELILLDGGAGHLNMAQKLISELGLVVAVAAVAKGPTRKNLEFRISNFESNPNIKNVLKDKNLIKQIMGEAHRFAITYHKKLRGKSLLG